MLSALSALDRTVAGTAQSPVPTTTPVVESTSAKAEIDPQIPCGGAVMMTT